MQGYNGPAALNEGIRAMGDVFSPETAMNRQKAIMYKQQFEQTMKPLTLDEIASKTAPDLWGPMQKLAEANGIVEENNGVKFIRQGNLRQFHDDLGKNKIWQAQLLDESSKMNKAKLDEITPQFETAKKQWEASIAIYKYKAEQEMAKAKEEGRPPDVPALMKLEEQIKEAQNKYPVYKQMMTLGQQREAIMGSYKKRITSMGLLDEGFKKDVEKYGEPDAIKIALNPEYRRQLDMQRMKDEARIKADEIRYTEQVKAGLKPEEKWSDPYMDTIGGKKAMFRKNLVTNKVEKVGEDKSTTVVVNSGSEHKADANNAMKLRKEFNALPEIKERNQTIPKIKSMKAAFAESKKTNNFVAVDQALITLYNKLTDTKQVSAIFKQYNPEIIVIERVTSAPTDGRVSASNFL